MWHLANCCIKICRLYALNGTADSGHLCAGFRHEASILPFELHVLEVAIGDVCQLCSGLVKELESSGHPILDTLVKHVRPLPLNPLSISACHRPLFVLIAAASAVCALAAGGSDLGLALLVDIMGCGSSSFLCMGSNNTQLELASPSAGFGGTVI